MFSIFVRTLPQCVSCILWASTKHYYPIQYFVQYNTIQFTPFFALCGLLNARLDSPFHMSKRVEFKAMAVDKKVADGELRLILLKGELGGCVMTGDFDEAAMRATIQDFCDRQ